MTLNDQWIFHWTNTYFFVSHTLGYRLSTPQSAPVGQHHRPNHKTGAKKLAVANSGNPTRHGNVKVPFFNLSADDFSSKNHLIILIGGFNAHETYSQWGLCDGK